MQQSLERGRVVAAATRPQMALGWVRHLATRDAARWGLQALHRVGCAALGRSHHLILHQDGEGRLEGVCKAAGRLDQRRAFFSNHDNHCIGGTYRRLTTKNRTIARTIYSSPSNSASGRNRRAISRMPMRWPLQPHVCTILVARSRGHTQPCVY